MLDPQSTEVAPDVARGPVRVNALRAAYPKHPEVDAVVRRPYRSGHVDCVLHAGDHRAGGLRTVAFPARQGLNLNGAGIWKRL